MINFNKLHINLAILMVLDYKFHYHKEVFKNQLN